MKLKMIIFGLSLLSGCNTNSGLYSIIPNNPNSIRFGIKEGAVIISQPIIVSRKKNGDYITLVELRTEVKPSFDEKNFIPQPDSAIINFRIKW